MKNKRSEQTENEISHSQEKRNVLYSIIIPCYRSSKTIRKVVELTMKELEAIGKTEYEFVLVDDCSPDGGETMAALMGLVRDYTCVRVVELAKNAGQHNAVIAGLNAAKGDVFIAMDDDMQTHPSQLKFLLEKFEEGTHDIVYGYYPHKKHSKFRNFGSYINYLSVRILLKKPKDLKTSSFWVIKKFVRDYAIEYKSAYTHLQGLFLRTTRNICSVPIEHFDREVGTSNYTLKKLLKLWSNIHRIFNCATADGDCDRIYSFLIIGIIWGGRDRDFIRSCGRLTLAWLAIDNGGDLFFLRNHSAVYGR